MRPIKAGIRLDALRHNLGVAQRCAPHSHVFAVIKANAYGHGALRAARALDAADGLALLELDVAVRLREDGYAKRLALLEGLFAPDELTMADQYELAITVHNEEQLRMLDSAPRGARFDVMLKINTGMNRLGFTPRAARPAYERLKTHRAVNKLTLMTHFATADDTRGVAAQMSAFNEITAGLDAERSAANSAAILRYPESHADWVRPGIMLYGCSPFADVTAQALGLKPVMTLASEIISVQELQPGEAVGYAGAFVAPQVMRVGTIACGYADGYPRHAPTGTPVLVGGQRTRTLGRISMDMLCVDLTGVACAGVGAPVVLWGDGLPADEVAASAGTVSYEMLCAVAPRVPMAGI